MLEMVVEWQKNRHVRRCSAQLRLARSHLVQFELDVNGAASGNGEHRCPRDCLPYAPEVVGRYGAGGSQALGEEAEERQAYDE